MLLNVCLCECVQFPRFQEAVTLLSKQTSFSKYYIDTVMLSIIAFPRVILTEVNFYLHQSDEETSGTQSLENAMTLLITEYENNEL